MQFDLGLAWSDGVGKVRDNFQLLAIVAGVFMFLPSAIFTIAAPDLMAAASGAGMNPQDPTAILKLFTPMVIIGYLVMTILSTVGYTAMIALMHHDQKLTVGEAITRGFRALPTLLGVFVLFFIAYILAAVVVGVVVGLLVAGLGAISGALAGIVTFVLVVGLFVAILWVFARLSMIMPVVAIEGVTNPVTVLKRSWSMTGPAQWRLLGFYVLLFVAYMVIALLVFGLLGVVVSAAGGIAILGILSSLLGMVVAMFFSGILAAVHRQLSGSSGESLTDTFG
ncbi:hypothetical protein [Pontixanthobacter aquaemixtae]|uniref:DUF7847 domain-containing protein n=1 Tax=Pontixanthobacter aquaemixtae TaxID=1958940 RepID=A0A844ZNF6_9SPHN|nr:hypothetical protein [Pontixanthobacter aquaemixtae]MXO89375.1 hypothetical protein [Pontixanthobacter aquaemixtae]